MLIPKKSLAILILLILASPPLAADYMQTRIIQLEQALTQLREIIFNHTFKLSQQQQQIQNLQGEIELLNYELELLKNSQAQPITPQSITPSSPVESTTISEPAVPLTEKQTNPAPTVSNKTITYQEIVEEIQAGDYEKVITSSKKFLKLYPQSPQADEVQYLLGHTYYVLKRLNSALTAFSTLLEKYPNSPRNAEALLIIGYVYYDKNDYATAQAIFQQIKETYPDTSVAQFAKQRLQEIRKKGY